MSDWAYNDRPGGVAFLPARVAEPLRTEIEDQIWTWIVRGEDDPAEFVDYLSDEDEHPGITDEELAAAYVAALEARRAQQRGWGPVESNLTVAFDQLNRVGVLARENFTCCGTCASTEIHDERDDSRHWLGYLWYHQQDTDGLLESADGSVYVGFGAYPPADMDWAAYDTLPEDVKRDNYQADVERLMDDVVFPVLREHGMGIEWNRSLGTRILVTGAHWYASLV